VLFVEALAGPAGAALDVAPVLLVKGVVADTNEGSTMAVWIVKAGGSGDQEPIALNNDLVTIHWNELPDLSVVQSQDELAELYQRKSDETNPHALGNAVGQVWAFCSKIETGDLVILPLVTLRKLVLAVGEVTGPYAYRKDLGKEVRHTLPVEWLIGDLPRKRLDPDLSAAIDRQGTVCPIKSPGDAEERFRAAVRDEINRRHKRNGRGDSVGFEVDFLFKHGAGYDDLVTLIQSNPKYVFEVVGQDKTDRRTKKAKESGWVEIRHKQHPGAIRLTKNLGVCRASVRDQSGGLKLIGAWTSWLASNASDLMSGLDVRFA
jgi:hypothetical protein